MQHSTKTQLHELLQKHWGYQGFRPLQEEIISLVLGGRNALVLMPTGSGKSLCYQIPSLVGEGMVLVLSPLIALMKDQVDGARRHGLSAHYINSSQSRDEREAVIGKISRGEVRLLYVTPERFRKPEFLQALSGQKVKLFAVDEAHCISEWGHDFRPDYSRVGELRAMIGNPPAIALTATATRKVQADILKHLNLAPDTQVFRAGFERPNLELEIQDVYGWEDKFRRFVAEDYHTPGSKIIYFSLIESLKEFSRELDKMGRRHLVYHGGLPKDLRKKNQKRFIQDPESLILATPAFGLGVDKPNIRMVVHAELPGSIEAYYQEVGRAGRDGLPSRCVLFYDADDISIQMDFLKWGNPDPSFIRQVYRMLETKIDPIRQGGYDYLRGQMHFYHSRDFRVETTIKLLHHWGVLENLHQPSQWKLVDQLPEDVLDQASYELHVKAQQQKLFELVQLCKEPTDLMKKVVEYFEVS